MRAREDAAREREREREDEKKNFAYSRLTYKGQSPASYPIPH